MGIADEHFHSSNRRWGSEAPNERERIATFQAIAWKGNDFIVYAMDDKGDENFHLKRVNLKSGEVKDLTPFPKVRSEIIDDLEDVSDTDILITLNKRNPEVFDAFRLNVATGEMKWRPKTRQSGRLDHRSRRRHPGGDENDGVNANLLTRPDEKTPFKKVLTTNFRESVSPQFYTFDNKNLYVTSNIGRDKAAVVTIDPSNGKELEKIYENPDVDVDALAYSKKRKVMTFAVLRYLENGTKVFRRSNRSDVQDARGEKLPGYEVEVTANDKAEEKFIVVAINDRSPGSRNLFDAKTGTLTKLVDVAPWLKESELAPMKPIEYQSRDGLTIHGYLTLPLGREAKNLPVVVNPHGGPWARDTWGFNPEVQFLANRGYAVLQMNFRGSTGYGRKFWEASFKQWGQTMQNDITDGVAMADQAGDCRSETDRDLRRQLWRLRHSRGRHFYPGSLRRGGRLRWGGEHVYVYENDSALLEAASRHVPRNGRRPGKRQGDDGSCLTGHACGQNQDTALRRPGSARSAGEQGRIRSDGRGPEETRRASRIHGERQRRPRFS